MFSRVAILLLGTVLLVPGAGAQDLSSLEDLKERYDRLGALRASFIQIIQSEFSNDSTRIQGEVLLEGNKYRVETRTQTVVTDGSTTWIYSPADSQVVVNSADSSTRTITPQTFLTASTESYDVESITSESRNQTPHTVMSLTAAESTTRFTSATLWIRQEDYIVTRLQATDRNGATLDLQLSNIRFDPALPNQPFSFDVPEGVDVIDLRSNSSP